jgi:hypothetical protein
MSNKGPSSMSKSLDGTSGPMQTFTPSSAIAIVPNRKSSIPIPLNSYNQRFKTSHASSMPTEKTQLDSTEESDDESSKYGEIFDFTYKPKPRIPELAAKTQTPKNKTNEQAVSDVVPELDSLEKEGEEDKSAMMHIPDEGLFDLDEFDRVSPMLNAFGRVSLGPRTEAQQKEADIAILGTRPSGVRKFNPKGY